MDETFLKENEVGIIFGNDSSAKPVIEAAKIMEDKHDTQLLGSGYIFQSMNSTVNMNLSSIFQLRGVNFSVSSACASGRDRKSTRLNSSHANISYAVFCLKKKKKFIWL